MHAQSSLSIWDSDWAKSASTLASGFIECSATVTFDSSRWKRYRTGKYLRLLLVPGALVLNLTFPWLRHGMVPDAWGVCWSHDGRYCDRKVMCKTRLVTMIMATLNIVVFGSLLLLICLHTSRTSQYLTKARIFFVLQWLMVQIEGFATVVELCGGGTSNRRLWGDTGYLISLSLWLIVTCMLQHQLIARIRAMEQQIGMVRYGSILIRVSRAEIAVSFFSVAFAAVGMLLTCAGVLNPDLPGYTFALSVFTLVACLIFLLLMVTFLVIACQAFRVPVQLLEAGQKYPFTDRERAVFDHALRVSVRTLFWVKACGITTIGSALALAAYAMLHRSVLWVPLALRICILADGVTHSICILLTSGLVRKRVSNDRQNEVASSDRQEWTGTDDPDWHAHVQDLATRAVTLEALLLFWQQLGRDCMPHFDPKRHRTTDVVRSAVIPMSARGDHGPCALSSILMRSTRKPADRMVSHAWDNLFAHLVAAVVADALDMGAYESILPRLVPSKISGLMMELQRKELLGITYWICAFCVNQHKSICSQVSRSDRDPVTGNMHPTCACGESLILNTTPPIRSDGQSISCEMNKFDDMIVYLGACNDGFRHVIAVDQSLTLFDRAWCIAEIHQANRCGYKQFLIFYSCDSVRRHTGKLRDLHIQRMESSRSEDKFAILEKIDDVNAFNKDLRRMICDQHTGLLQQWMDATGDFAFVGQATKIVYRHSSRSLRSKPSRGTISDGTERTVDADSMRGAISDGTERTVGADSMRGAISDGSERAVDADSIEARASSYWTPDGSPEVEPVLTCIGMRIDARERLRFSL